MKYLPFVFLLLLTLAGLCSCQSSSKLPEEALAAPAAESADKTGRDSAELAYALVNKTWCSNDEAASLILLLVHGQDTYDNFAQRRDALVSEGFMSAAWKLEAEEPVTKGTLAYMLCRALDIKGGLLLHLAPCRRYAYREAVYQDLMVRGGDNEPLTGPEVVGIMSRAGQRKAGQELQRNP